MKVLLFLGNRVELFIASAFIDVFGWHRDYCNGNIEVITCHRLTISGKFY